MLPLAAPCCFDTIAGFLQHVWARLMVLLLACDNTFRADKCSAQGRHLHPLQQLQEVAMQPGPTLHPLLECCLVFQLQQRDYTRAAL